MHNNKEKPKQPDYVTRDELNTALLAQDKHTEEIVRQRTLVIEKQLHKHITARFNVAKVERDAAHIEVMKVIKNLGDQLKPIAKNYEAAGTIGKWVFAFLTFITILVTALANLKAGGRQFVDLAGHIFGR